MYRRSRCSVLILALVTGLPLSAVATVIYDNGPSDPANFGSHASEAASRGADDFQLLANDTIRSIQFWGAHWQTGVVPAVEDFQIVIYADLAGAPDPGTLLATSALTLVSRIDTGFDHNANGTADIWEYTMDLASPVSLTAGTVYWLSVYLQTNAPGTAFVWQQAGIDGTGNHYASVTSGTTWAPASSHFAFNLSNTSTTVPEPTGALLMMLALGAAFVVRAGPPAQ